METDRYLTRLGVDPATVEEPTLDALAALQRAHVETVPFENLAITGRPGSEQAGTGVRLEPDALFEKLVEQRRGGFCYELNGLFARLLEELGFDVRYAAGAVLTDGEPRPPANHLTGIVTLDRQYVVDVGLGGIPIRRPLPLSGAERTDRAGITWRVVESPRPDADFLTRFRVGEQEWTDRYVFGTTPRDLSYVRATCDYLTTAPESPFTGEPVLTVATEDGYAKLSNGELTRLVDGEERTRSVDSEDRDEVAADVFGLRPGAD